MSKSAKYQPSEKAQAFLDSVSNGKYPREIISGLKKFMDGKAPEDMQTFYSADELKALVELGGQRGKRLRLAQLDRDLSGWDYEVRRLDVLTAVALQFSGDRVEATSKVNRAMSERNTNSTVAGRSRTA